VRTGDHGDTWERVEEHKRRVRELLDELAARSSHRTPLRLVPDNGGDDSDDGGWEEVWLVPVIPLDRTTDTLTPVTAKRTV
jgi:hypothetical protein